MSEQHPPVVALVGPTAVGKTAVAVELAELLSAEIVSCDSMQVYRQMPILSQAPTHAQRTRVLHHLVECVQPTEPFSVGEYRHRAIPVLSQLLARGKSIVIVGGTGLYLRALTQGLCEAPPADLRVREQLWSECQGSSSAAMHNRLRGVDAVAASRIHPNDVRRIIRALEVFALTGKPLSIWWREGTSAPLCRNVIVIGLDRDRESLYDRINRRLLEMLYEQGVIQEVRMLLRLPLSKMARQVHGLIDLERYLDGRTTLKETLTTWQQRVRNYARRQLVWFRRTPGIRWVGLNTNEHSWETASRLADVVRRAQQDPASIDA